MCSPKSYGKKYDGHQYLRALAEPCDFGHRDHHDRMGLECHPHPTCHRVVSHIEHSLDGAIVAIVDVRYLARLTRLRKPLGYVGTPPTNWWVHRNSLSVLAFSPGTGTTTRSRSTTRSSASRTYRGISAASGLIFCATEDDGSARSIVPLATRGAAASGISSHMRHGRRLHDNA